MYFSLLFLFLAVPVSTTQQGLIGMQAGEIGPKRREAEPQAVICSLQLSFDFRLFLDRTDRHAGKALKRRGWGDRGRGAEIEK